jgi:hypothetical protein
MGATVRTGWSGRKEKGYSVYTETIRESKGGGSHLSSVIDFLPAGKDFTIIANAGGTTLSDSTHLEMYACDSSIGTFVRVQSRLTDASTTAKKDINTTPHAYQWDGSIDGWYPYYKIDVVSDGDCDVGDTIKLVIMFATNTKD